jgi:hypothetical protein
MLCDKQVLHTQHAEPGSNMGSQRKNAVRAHRLRAWVRMSIILLRYRALHVDKARIGRHFQRKGLMPLWALQQQPDDRNVLRCLVRHVSCNFHEDGAARRWLAGGASKKGDSTTQRQPTGLSPHPKE